jgi:hypothetical protein
MTNLAIQAEGLRKSYRDKSSEKVLLYLWAKHTFNKA